MCAPRGDVLSLISLVHCFARLGVKFSGDHYIILYRYTLQHIFKNTVSNQSINAAKWGNAVCRPRGETAKPPQPLCLAKLVLFARVRIHRTNAGFTWRSIHRALSLLILPLRGIFLSILSMPGLRKLTQKSRLLAQRMVRMEEPLPIETREEGVGASPLGSRPSKMVPVPFYCPSNTRRRLLSVCPVFARPEIAASHVGAPLPAGVLLSSGSGSGP